MTRRSRPASAPPSGRSVPERNWNPSIRLLVTARARSLSRADPTQLAPRPSMATIPVTRQPTHLPHCVRALPGRRAIPEMRCIRTGATVGMQDGDSRQEGRAGRRGASGRPLPRAAASYCDGQIPRRPDSATARYKEAPVTMQGERAVVLGGGMAGLLAARVLSDAYSEVIVVDRDELTRTSR